MASCENTGKMLSAGDIVKMMPNGKFVCMNDIIFYVLCCRRDGKGTRRWITMDVRELRNEEISTILIGWNSTDTVPVYTVSYVTRTMRPGAKKSEYGEIYNSKLKNSTFQILDVELRECLYKGNYVCKDLANAAEYSFINSTKKVRDELSKLKAGDIVSTCRFQNTDYFVASYRYSKPVIMRYDQPQKVLMKRGMKYKMGTTEFRRNYVVWLIDGYNDQAEYQYPYWAPAISMKICEEVKESYGYANGFDFDGERVVVFTDFADFKTYPVPIDTVNKQNFEALCEDSYIMKAYITIEGTRTAYLDKTYPTERLEQIEYVYSDGGKAYCMDVDTYELYEVPFRYLPRGAKENDVFYGSASSHDDLKQVELSGRVYALHKRK